MSANEHETNDLEGKGTTSEATAIAAIDTSPKEPEKDGQDRIGDLLAQVKDRVNKCEWDNIRLYREIDTEVTNEKPWDKKRGGKHKYICESRNDFYVNFLYPIVGNKYSYFKGSIRALNTLEFLIRTLLGMGMPAPNEADICVNLMRQLSRLYKEKHKNSIAQVWLDACPKPFNSNKPCPTVEKLQGFVEEELGLSGKKASGETEQETKDKESGKGVKSTPNQSSERAIAEAIGAGSSRDESQVACSGQVSTTVELEQSGLASNALVLDAADSMEEVMEKIGAHLKENLGQDMHSILLLKAFMLGANDSNCSAEGIYNVIGLLNNVTQSLKARINASSDSDNSSESIWDYFKAISQEVVEDLMSDYR